ncbi:MAG: DUF5681 domain-containing protein [Methylovulum sp.]
MAKFQKGLPSPNPQGRPKGNATAARLREAISEQLPDIIETLTRLAKDGDVQASKLLMDRCLPPLKAQSEVVTINTVPDDTTATIGRLIIDAALRADIPADAANMLLSGLANQVRIEEYTLLESRIAALEGSKV